MAAVIGLERSWKPEIFHCMIITSMRSVEGMDHCIIRGPGGAELASLINQSCRSELTGWQTNRKKCRPIAALALGWPHAQPALLRSHNGLTSVFTHRNVAWLGVDFSHARSRMTSAGKCFQGAGPR